MLIVRQSHVSEGFFGWLTWERRNWIGAVILSFCAGAALMNGHTTQDAIKHVSQQYGQAAGQLKKAEKTLPALTAAEMCEHNRGERIKELALQTQLVDPSQIPPDCPHPVAPPLK